MEFQSLACGESCRYYTSHYERLGKVSEGSDFDDDWKEEVEDRVNNCKCASELFEDEVLDKIMDRNEIAQCLRKIKNNKTGVVMV